MNATTEKTKIKRPSKSKRKHIRQIKQDGRKEGLSETEIKKKVQQIP
ncbi:MAG: hypothetical protein HY867_19815 [Chloroflexi bacterium]|nr:hypothetical protein [Chloroflexota bacterium]